jgi:hypothetical protein
VHARVLERYIHDMKLIGNHVVKRRIHVQYVVIFLARDPASSQFNDASVHRIDFVSIHQMF